ncbi:MAG: ATP phosphoribosyltransferase [Lentisphaeria bacterium]|nr:ATP phosphoribosyltransferase [Lentisphaeria bacterium]
MEKLMLGIPKGSLEQSTVDLFAKAGYKIQISSRSYYPSIDDPEIECLLIRAQEMSRYVEEGIIDCGLTGYDWIRENNSDVHEAAELVYGKVGTNPLRWVLAVPNDSPIQSVKDLEGKRISTEAVGMTNRYLAENGVTAKVEFSWGATEVKPPRLADAIVEITETGSSLRANNLRIVDTLCISTTRFIANHNYMKSEFKRRKIENIAMLLQGVMLAKGKCGLMLNARKDQLDEILKLLPALEKPTVSPLSDAEWVAVNTIVPEHVARELIPELKRAGAKGIVEFPINKIIE